MAQVIELLRPDGFLYLQARAANLVPGSAVDGAPVLVPAGREPTFLTVTFQLQHLAGEAFFTAAGLPVRKGQPSPSDHLSVHREDAPSRLQTVGLRQGSVDAQVRGLDPGQTRTSYGGGEPNVALRAYQVRGRLLRY